jgi:hypothetical protein
MPPDKTLDEPLDKTLHCSPEENSVETDRIERFPLHETVTSVTTGAETTGDSMSDDPRIEKVVNLIKEMLADERQKTLDSILGAVTGGVVTRDEQARITRHPDAEKSTRAPAGSARVLCKRALNDAAEFGLTTKIIQEKANGPYERMLSTSAIRNELTTGSLATPPLYKQVGGVWYLAEFAPTGMRIVS